MNQRNLSFAKHSKIGGMKTRLGLCLVLSAKKDDFDGSKIARSQESQLKLEAEFHRVLECPIIKHLILSPDSL